MEDEYKLLKNECCKLKNENLTLSEKIDYTNKNITKLKQENEALRSNCSAELANYQKLFFDQGASFIRNEIEYKIGSKLIEVFEKSENTGFSSKTLSEIEQLHDYLNQSKNETLLSVIIPVFNTEKYVSQCLDSVLSQNIDNMEVICIDDGSTDNSLKVLEKYRDTDKRVKIIKQSNRSAGAARNIGLQNCSGKYVHFLDSDDWVCDKAYSNLIKMIKINDSDVVMFTYNKYDNVTKECTISTCFDNLPETMKYKEVSGKDYIEYLLKSAVMPWNKLYKRDFLLTNKIVFDEITIANDRTFYFNMLSKNPRIVIDNNPYINYRINNKDSLVGEARLRHFDCHFKCFSSMRDIYFNTKNYSVILDLFFKDLMYFYQKATLEQRKKIKKDITDYIENNREYFKDDIFNKEKSSYYFYNMLMNKKSIPIVFGVDKNYLPYLSVALVSLIHNSSNLYKYDIYILHTELENKDIEIISKLGQPNINVNFINVLKEIDSIALYSRAHYSISMYYRILIPKLFSQLEKVIYLDCDILVVDDISKLYFSYIGNNQISAAVNYLNRDMQKYVKSKLNMDYPKYINSGILIINIKEWLKNSVSEKIFDYIESHKDLVCPDQDAINCVCKNKIKYLPSSWNFTWQHIVLETTLPYEQQKNFEDDASKPKSIIHYTSGIKPWKKMNWDNNEYAENWWKYAERSPFYKFFLTSLDKV